MRASLILIEAESGKTQTSDEIKTRLFLKMEIDASADKRQSIWRI